MPALDWYAVAAAKAPSAARPELEAQPLIAFVLGSLAVAVAIFTFFGSDQRLRESGGSLLRIVSIFAGGALGVAALLLGEQTSSQFLVDVGAYGAAGLTCAGWLAMIAVFARAYGRVFYLRERRVTRHLWPFRVFSNWRASRSFVSNIERRKVLSVPGVIEDGALDCTEGYSVLIVGPRMVDKRPLAYSILVEGLRDGDETGEYVCCDRHPTLAWRAMRRDQQLDDHPVWLKNFRMTDAYSRNLAFDDAVAVDSLRGLRHKNHVGLTVRSVRTLAGVHTAGSSGWYRRRGGGNGRKPHRIVYDTLSTLADSAGPQRVRDFYLHAVSSEKLNGMFSVFIEHDDIDPVMLRAIEGAADIVIGFEEPASGGVPRLLRSPFTRGGEPDG